MIRSFMKIVCCLLLLGLPTNELSAQSLQIGSREVTLRIQFNPRRPLNRFIPSHALGAGVDGHEIGDSDRQLTPANIRAMRSAGLKSLAYRLRTELAVEAWHWNPHGTWSNPTEREGYWTSSVNLEQPIGVSFGYRLPRRGNTIDQANNDGYSRLDDGDSESFWKSNPYLDKYFTNEANTQHPQWIVVDVGSIKRINAIRLQWGTPFATSYEVQYANFDDTSDISFNPPGMWQTFPHGRIHSHWGGEVFITLSSRPIKTRFLRILMTEASGTSAAKARDVRDSLGYAMREVYVGFSERVGNFIDYVHHSMDHDNQTLIYVSSTDCWHREGDLDEEVEQPGFDRVYQSGLTNGLPMLVATGLLYATPEDAAAEIRYLIAKGYPVERVELGEEPDGQFVTPEDYGALYLQFALALHKVSPKLSLGGPSFQEILPDETLRPIKLGNSAWLQRFLKYLKAHGRLQEYSFFSFEWYPFDDVCDPVAPQLARSTGILTEALRNMVKHGLSREIPWIISEYGYSAFASRAELGIEGALLNADIVARFLSLGGDQAFLYGYTPGQVAKEVDCTAGNNMMFSMDGSGNITHRFATYFAAQLITEEWLKPAGLHQLYPVVLCPPQRKYKALITAYAVYGPNRVWSLLIINKDPGADYRVQVQFTSAKTLSGFLGPIDVHQYSRANYQLNNDLHNPFPVKSEPPEHFILRRIEALTLPAYSLTVLTGQTQ